MRPLSPSFALIRLLPDLWAKTQAPTGAEGKCLLQLSLNSHSFGSVKRKPTPEFEVIAGRCAGTEVCPLSRVQAGTVVCIKRLTTAPELTDRLRELGLCEDQRIKLLARQHTFICQVCNARLAISGRLADSIMVEAATASLQEA
jgi:Fe2+ transport system protein FeoA